MTLQERLRGFHHNEDYQHLMDEAADEIDRLTAALLAVRRHNDHPGRYNEDLAAIVESALAPPASQEPAG